MDSVLVVLNYNDYNTTLNFIEMALKNKLIEKIVVVDNCSTDHSYQLLKKEISERVDVIKTKKNGGYAYGNNWGCKYAIKKYNPKILFISNPDVEFTNDVLKKMQDTLSVYEGLAVVAPIVKQGYNVWKIPGFIGTIESLFLIWFNLDKRNIKKKLIHSPEEVVRVGVVEGSFFAIKVDVYEEIEGFDERTFLYYEENILAKKLESKGYYEAVLRDYRYNHFHSVSIKKNYKSKRRAYKNFYYSIKLYLDEYLKCNGCEKLVFHMAYFIGYMERIIYDILK